MNQKRNTENRSWVGKNYSKLDIKILVVILSEIQGCLLIFLSKSVISLIFKDRRIADGVHFSQTEKGIGPGLLAASLNYFSLSESHNLAQLHHLTIGPTQTL